MAAGVFESLYTAYSTTLSTVANTYAGQWTPIAVAAFAASGAIYFTILGFLVIRGAVARPLAELAVSATKFALVIAALGSLGLVPLAMSGINQLGPALLGEGNGNIGQSMDNYFKGIDKLEAAMEAREANVAAAAASGASNQSVASSIVSSLTGVDLDQAIEKLEDFIAFCVALVCAGISAAIGFCVLFFAQIALDIVLAFTPIAIACCFWPQTRWFFQGWLSQAINYVVLYIVVIIISKMVIAASVTTITTFVGPSADIVAVTAAVDPGAAAAQFLQEAAEVMLVYLVGTFLFFQAPSIASGLAGGAASGGHTFLAIAANQIASRIGGGGGRALKSANPARGGSITRG